ncbi:hypothetical protein C8R47DRAFT_422304 [Mycena vitilis]|nr:hypothetical protein C8R47DRAFT_422304 [Mycena vitilis]
MFLNLLPPPSSLSSSIFMAVDGRFGNSRDIDFLPLVDHFACHGSRHPEPFNSAFELHRGDRVTVLDIAGANLPRAEFAFLSACHTTTAPDIATPDEFITLAAALQFAGFRGVVSTFWEMMHAQIPI